MQITCPACAAVYEAPDDAIPEGGRMVRCSACRAEWRARRAAPAGRGNVEAAAPALAASRRADAPPAAAALPAAPASPAPPVQTPPAAAPPALVPSGPVPSGAAPRSDPPPPMLASLEEEPEASRPRSGFLIGFAVTAVLSLGAVALYARHDAVAAAAPQLAGPIARYVETVDRGRQALADLVERGRAALDEASGG
ncbi:zinc-ribbon domain-containing protein [Rubrimonas cliftonensis]|uniref:MJ0042 family finger-like domain-containing protein n=1 Tax=Rubrimonas cliftonensis TaxID=89524 RepID=A0A1H4ANB1_9RHOB|nr:zinc-ribbon domain-containing protein [Rubrimonas cliftonensis]SEA37439.1 MJ0042 family finger-like domain-containing protein [Rubrimonas cliftonensis]